MADSQRCLLENFKEVKEKALFKNFYYLPMLISHIRSYLFTVNA